MLRATIFSLHSTGPCDLLTERAVLLEQCARIRGEFRSSAEKRKERLAAEVFRCDGLIAIELAAYWCKASKNVAILSSLHPDVQFPR